MDKNYDAIIVGARCAGAPTAMLLARKGYRVLVVDRASFPSDTLSTHMIHAPGVAAMKRWGVLDKVIASGCPPVETYSFDFGPFTIKGTPRPSDGNSVGYAPRRTILDKILVDAAVQAGAEVRERFTVEEIVIEDGVVVGIRGHDEGGSSVIELPMAATRSLPRRFRRFSTTRSRCCSGAITRTGVACPSTVSRSSSDRIVVGRRSARTTA